MQLLFEAIKDKDTRLCTYIYIYAFSRRFYPKRLTVHSGYTFFISMLSLSVYLKVL